MRLKMERGRPGNEAACIFVKLYKGTLYNYAFETSIQVARESDESFCSK